MEPSVAQLPETETLAAALASVVGAKRRSSVTIVNRQPIVPFMTFPAEIVTCRLARGNELKLFCKYEAGRNHNAYGHRGGVAYEAEVHRRVLQPMRTTTPKYFGAWKDPVTADTWLVLAYLEDGRLLRDVHLDLSAELQPTEMGLAARWIGKFHAATAKKLANQALAFLNRYDAGYYLGWARRSCELAGKLHQKFPWLARLCQRAEEILTALFAAPPTVIHGEYYQNNILIRERIVCPSDWESAAIAAGEIDLAALTEGSWAADIVQQCKQEYQHARWPRGTPAEFEPRLAAARLYLHFRWLGERHEWTTHKESRWRFAELRRAADQMGIINTTRRDCPKRSRIAPGPRATQLISRVY